MRLLLPLARWITLGVLWVWAVAKFVSDVFGVASLLDNPGAAQDLGRRFLSWLFATPWWVPGLLATLATFALISHLAPRNGMRSGLALRREVNREAAAWVIMSYKRETDHFTVLDKHNVRSVRSGGQTIPEGGILRTMGFEFTKDFGDVGMSVHSTKPGRVKIHLNYVSPRWAHAWVHKIYEDQEILVEFYRERKPRKRNERSTRTGSGERSAKKEG